MICNRLSFILTVAIILLATSVYAQIDTIFSKAPVFKGQYFSNTLPDSQAVLFAEGLIDPQVHHFHSAPVFSPDCQEMYFSLYVNYEFPQRIFVTKKVDGLWQKPQLAAFSGQYFDGAPVFSPDGSVLYFYSRRPISRADSTAEVSRIWFVKREGEKWSSPELLPFDASLGGAFYPDYFASNGIFYFTVKAASRDYDIYQCRIENDVPIDIKRLNEPISVIGKIENKAVTNPDNSILIFQMYDRYDQKKLILQFCTKQNNGEWSDPAPLSEKINKGSSRFASFSRDGKYFFYTSSESGTEEIYWVKSIHLFD